MNLELLDAVGNAAGWMRRFNRREYEKAFREYSGRFGQMFSQAAAETGNEGLPTLAEDLLDGLDEGWSRTPFWRRSAARYNQRQVVVLYLSPMLLGLEEPAPALAEALRDGWRKRWPEDGYEIAGYETIRRGFRNVIMGMDIGRLGARRDGEDQEWI